MNHAMTLNFADASGNMLPEDTMTVTFARPDGSEIFFVMYHDDKYIPDCIIAQCPTRELEPELSALLVRAIRPGDTVVDAGANVGLFTLLMAKLVGPTGLVHAFEPHPDTCGRLDRNVVLHTSLNKAPNITVHQTALWDANRDLTLYTCFEPGLASLRPYDGWTGSRTVRTERLDCILNTPPRLIKMDVEGSELTALKGASVWLGCVPYITTELSRQNLGYHNVTPEQVATYMLSFGKELWVLDRDGRSPTRVPPGQQWPGTSINQMALFATEAAVREIWQ